jgi:hypothetical protein
MNRTEILNSLKNSVYEFEGLLELLTARSEKSADLLPLLSARLSQVNSLFDSLKAENSPEIETEVAAPVTPVEDTPVYVAAEEEEPVYEAPAQPEPMVGETQRKAPAFCLNDRFRFRRNVFGGDVSLFDKVCERVSRMKDYEEAEQYFFGELGLDASDSDVEDFMTIIREYFGK